MTDKATEVEDSPVIQMKNVFKSFGPVEVLKDVDFDLVTGEVHALAGENGAGKSTLMKILQGVYSITSGTIEVEGKPVAIKSTADAEAAGIGMVFQEFSLVPSMTVAQNIVLNQEPRNALGLVDDKEAVRLARGIFDALGVDIDPTAPLGSLGTAYWQLVEIAKALAKNAKVLIMDEPTASLAKHEVENLFELIQRLRSQGISIVYISHRMEEIRRVADRITVLRDGRVAMTERLADVSPADVVHAIIGKRLAREMEYEPHSVPENAEVVLDARDITDNGVLDGITLQVRRGEIIGLAGLMGSGRTEFARVISGLVPIASGSLSICGKPPKVAAKPSKDGRFVALIPEDRRAQGLVLQHSVADNLALPSLPALSKGPFITPKSVDKTGARLVSEYGVRVADIDAPISLLSGGNQQKVVVAKWMNTSPQLLVMDEPTAGVDIGTKTEIIEMIRQYAADGGTVVFISSELPELLAISDRVAVFQKGQISRILDRDEIRDEEQLQLIIQGAAE